MLPKIQKILYATDLSDNSRLAFGYAASLAKRYQAQIMVLHVIEPVNPNTYMQISGAMGESEWVNLQLDFESTMVDDLGKKL
ncbi:MAG: universal stress protein, partial [Desulfobacteraceae bacterium]